MDKEKKDINDKEEEQAPLCREVGRIQRTGFMKSKIYVDRCSKMQKTLEDIYATTPRKQCADKMLEYLDRMYDYNSSKCQAGWADCQMVVGYQMLTLYGCWDYNFLKKLAKMKLKEIRSSQIPNSNFLEASLQDILCYFYIRCGKLGNAHASFKRASEIVSWLEPCDLTAGVYRLLGIWHMHMVSVHSVADVQEEHPATLTQNKHFSSALQFFHQSKEHITSFVDSGGYYKKYDILLANQSILRSLMKLPWLRTITQGKTTYKQNYNIDQLCEFVWESRVTEGQIKEALKIMADTKTEMKTLGKVPIFMQDEVAAMEVFIMFREAQLNLCEVTVYEAVGKCGYYNLKKYDSSSGWIAVVPRVVQNLLEEIRKTECAISSCEEMTSGSDML